MPVAPAPEFPPPVLLLPLRLIQDAVFQGSKTSAGKPTIKALRAAAWIRRDDRGPGSFHWCCLWLGIHAIRSAFRDGAMPIPGRAELDARLRQLRDPLNVAEAGHILLEHLRQCWREAGAREAAAKLGSN